MKQLILLHGALGNSIQLNPLKDRLTKDFDVHSLDFSGHGPDAYNGVFSTEVFADDVLKYMEDHGIISCNIFGYSMGGYVAIYLASKYEDKVENILTLGTKFDWNPESAARESSMLDPEVIEIKVPKYVDVLKTRYGLENWKQVLDKTAKMMLDLGNGSGLKEEELSRIKTKLLICCGSEDKMVTAKESLRVVSLLSNANYKEFDGFQHPIERVDMDVLAKEIASFGDCNRK